MMKSIEQDETVDREKVIIINHWAFCREHGAMNKQVNGTWRCFSMYQGNPDGVYPKGITPHKFVSRTCHAFWDGEV